MVPTAITKLIQQFFLMMENINNEKFHLQGFY